MRAMLAILAAAAFTATGAGFGFMAGGVPAAIFLGTMVIFVVMAATNITKNGHAIFAGTAMATVAIWYFGGLLLAVAGGLLGFLFLLSLHDFLLKKDAIMPLGLATMLVSGLGTFHFVHADIATAGFLATVVSIGAFLAWVGFYDHFLQRQHAIRRNFPVIGWCRYGLELIGDELRQYWFMGDREELPYNRKTRQFLYRSGKGLNNNLGFGTQEPYREVGKLHLLDNEYPIPDAEMGNMLPRLIIGKNRKQPYIPTWPLGVSHMSWGALSEEAVRALSSGARVADIHMGTGEGGYTPYHRDGVIRSPSWGQSLSYCLRMSLRFASLGLAKRPKQPEGAKIGGAKTVVEIGSAKFGLRTLVKEVISGQGKESGSRFANLLPQRLIRAIFSRSSGPRLHKIWSGKLDMKRFQELMAIETNVMVLVKRDQGAKKGASGKLPKEKITSDLADWRGISMDEDCHSPNVWDEWRTAAQLVEFGESLSAACGKPWGVKIAIGRGTFAEDLARVMQETGKGPDFIIVDGGEGGTGAGPVSLADTVGLPLFHAIPVVDTLLRKYKVRDRVVLVGAGRIAKGDDIMTAIALGCDMVDIARAFLIGGLGCIMAMRCHTNRCPTGITTQDPRLRRGLDPEDKYVRVANLAMVLQREIIFLCKSLGVRTPWELTRHNVAVVSEPMKSKTLAELYPYPDDGKRNPALAPALPSNDDTHDSKGPKPTKLDPSPARDRLVP